MAITKDIEIRTKFTGDADAKLKNLNNELSKTAVTAKGQLTPSLTQSSNQLTNFGRILQDMPYGVRGVANNIQFMAESMKQMSAQGISVTQQLKGMAASLMTGPGALLFAINAVTVAMTFFTSTSNKTKGEVKGLADELKGFWSETFKASKEWETFNEEVSKFTGAELTESLRAVREELDSSAFSFMDYIGLVVGANSVLGDAVKQAEKLRKELEILSGGNVARGRASITPGVAGGAGLSQESIDAANRTREIAEQRQNNELEIRLQLFKDIDNAVKQLNKDLDDQLQILGDVSVGFYATENKRGDRATIGKGARGAGLFVDKDALKKEFNFVNSMIMSSADVLRSEFISAWADIFGEANSLFEKLMQNIIDQLLQLGAQSIATSFLNLIFPGSGLLTGLFNPTTRGGNTAEQRIVIQFGEQEVGDLVRTGNDFNYRFRRN